MTYTGVFWILKKAEYFSYIWARSQVADTDYSQVQTYLVLRTSFSNKYRYQATNEGLGNTGKLHKNIVSVPSYVFDAIS